jgi:NADPH:quinone reductase
MSINIPKTMQAIAIDQFGGVDKLKLRTLPVPTIDADEVLVRLEYADVAVWDPAERQGYLDDIVKQITGQSTKFPLILGSEGAGTVAAVGASVTNVKVGDRVYASPFLNPKGGSYAEYLAVKSDVVSEIPGKLTVEQAAVMPGDAGTALRGLDDVLKVRAGESVLIFGAGGGLGHLAVQIAKRMGTRVLAVASGDDGVSLAKKIGADVAVNGRKEDVVAAARGFAPAGIDAILLTAGGEAAEKALTTLKPGGRAAHPHGVMPEPKHPAVKVEAYDGNIDGELIGRLNRYIDDAFIVNIAKTFPLEKAADAHRFLGEHYLGKVALKIS